MKFVLNKKVVMLLIFVIAIVLLTTWLWLGQRNPAPLFFQTKATQAMITPEQALAKLEAGNQRFVTGNLRQRDNLKLSKLAALKGQHPFALVLNCVDSRSDSLVVFDQGVGDIFTAAVAGNVISSNMLASMEFATVHAGASLIVIMGHTHCGAVQAACAGGVSGNIKSLTTQIKPAVTQVEAEQQNSKCEQIKLVDAIAKQNVLNQMAQTLQQSPKLKQLVAKQQVMLVGAMHDLSTGQVVFFDSTGQPLSAVTPSQSDASSDS